ncbi:MAG: hypothetical protein AB7E77_04930 [Desulfobulbus sp.]
MHGLVNDAKYPAILISSGNMLFKKNYSPAEPDIAVIAANAVVQATRAMGGKVMGVGSLDLAAGIPLLESLHHPPDFSLLSANLVDPHTGKPLFTPISRTTAGKVRIAILGLTDHHAAPGGPGFQVLPWQEVLGQALAEAQTGADFILLLSNYPLTENQEIARKFDQIDCILQAGHVIGNMVPIVINNTLISQTDVRGKFVGMLDIQWNGHGRWRETAVASTATEAVDSTFTNRSIALKMSMRNDPTVAAIVQQAQRQINQLRQH